MNGCIYTLCDALYGFLGLPVEEEHRARGCKYSLVFLQLALVIARQAVTSRRHCTQRTRKTRMSEASCKGASDQNA